jgi:hypothetical protein
MRGTTITDIPSPTTTATATQSNVALRARDMGLKLACLVSFALASIAVEFAWNVSAGELASIWDHFTLPLIFSGLVGGAVFLAITPTANRLRVHRGTYLLAQAATGVVSASVSVFVYYLFIGLMNLPFLPSMSSTVAGSMGPFVGVLLTPFAIVANALPFTLGIGAVTGVFSGMMMLRRQA